MPVARRCDDRGVAPVSSSPVRPASAPSAIAPYDAVLVYSFGGPEGPDDVLPFLRNVTGGTNVPEERLAEVAHHYELFGGRSPINDHGRALVAALRTELARRGADVPVTVGNRNWRPYTTEALRALRQTGARRVLAVVTSAYASYSGCRQYREDLARALVSLGASTPTGDDGSAGLVVDKLRAYFNDPGFVQANADAVAEAYEQLAARVGTVAASPAGLAPLVFVTHSIPQTMEEASGARRPSYRTQHLDVAGLVAEEVGRRLGATVEWTLAYCSRSGPPNQPWLEPDVNDALRELHDSGARSVVLAPIGFVADHMEVVYDLDTEALATAAELGLTAVRAGTASRREPFVSGLADLILERAAVERGEGPSRATVGALGPWPDVCLPGCCRSRPGVDSGVPAACGWDVAEPPPTTRTATAGVTGTAGLTGTGTNE